MKTTIQMQLVKETKNTFRYEAPLVNGLKPDVDCIYLQKSAVQGQAPKSVTVTVEA